MKFTKSFGSNFSKSHCCACMKRCQPCTCNTLQSSTCNCHNYPYLHTVLYMFYNITVCPPTGGRSRVNSQMNCMNFCLLFSFTGKYYYTINKGCRLYITVRVQRVRYRIKCASRITQQNHWFFMLCYLMYTISLNGHLVIDASFC